MTTTGRKISLGILVTVLSIFAMGRTASAVVLNDGGWEATVNDATADVINWKMTSSALPVVNVEYAYSLDGGAQQKLSLAPSLVLPNIVTLSGTIKNQAGAPIFDVFTSYMLIGTGDSSLLQNYEFEAKNISQAKHSLKIIDYSDPDLGGETISILDAMTVKAVGGGYVYTDTMNLMGVRVANGVIDQLLLVSPSVIVNGGVDPYYVAEWDLGAVPANWQVGGTYTRIIEPGETVIPEPTTGALGLITLAGLAVAALRRRNA